MQAVIARIVADIRRRCASEFGMKVAPALAGAMVRKVVLDPSAGFELDKELRDDDVERLVEMAVEALAEENSPELDALKLSLDYDSLSSENPVLVRALEREKAADAMRKSLLEDVIKSKARGIAALSALYRKILNYVVAAGRLTEVDTAASAGAGAGAGAVSGGDVGDDAAGEEEKSVLLAPSSAMLKECNAALESIFPHSELPAFVMLSASDKTQQLNEMAKIVVGILLYNRSIGKGGSHIVDVPGELLDESRQLREAVSGTAHLLAERISGYTALLNHIQFCNARLPVSLDRLNAELSNRRLLLQYMESLLDTASGLKATVNSSIAALNNKLDGIHGIVVAKHAVPTEQVYPRFVEVFHMWDNLATLRLQASSIRLVYDTMSRYLDSFRSSLEPALVAQANAALAQLQRKGEDEGESEDEGADAGASGGVSGSDEAAAAETLAHGVYVAPHEVESNLGLAGYCPWTLVYRNAMLLPGDASLGGVLFRGRHYVCVDEAALAAFQAHPGKYLATIGELVANDPELMALLAANEPDTLAWAAAMLEGGRSGGAGAGAGAGLGLSAGSDGPATREVGIQTEVHPLAPNKDPDYEWNEWNLRRKALMYVNLRTKATRSAQTAASAFRAEATTQHYMPKEARTQTTVDASTNVHPRARYVAGLRGKPGKGQVQVVDLTLDINID
ncbi:UPF0704 protein C6orf165 [Thecamonas trahens ATCC 50062]|uniref:Cilia- and flagella-associated protein 206 n=1 Tax=Thecamonas trahens ATCC 50062 TaxID=461836 RepID=A0A0L0D6U3_THETB|nr:UPF0704 protein C6orf165 [Thecamonas trahens ATCC 50062]KNC48067.1 UPF0704 protein C6orf165 [Thecamonas trahens ATCC 50062]|eukprot:XP_013759082.1 UPF0704 protein C6orf165 [Thecamonas trahens ATCC 50062]